LFLSIHHFTLVLLMGLQERVTVNLGSRLRVKVMSEASCRVMCHPVIVLREDFLIREVKFRRPVRWVPED
jgi:hypothetical protein